MKKDAVKEPKKFEEIIVKLRTALTREQDPDARKIIEDELNSFIELKDYFDKVRAAATAAPKPDLGKLGIETNPMPQPPQFGEGQSKPQTPTQKPATLADVQKMYPGVPADKLKEAYKRKFGVDLQ